ncbi:MAG TPA: type II secretion system protein [Armatimonadota bacterium]|jgi:type II secretory pathway pseudopilin PulG
MRRQQGMTVIEILTVMALIMVVSTVICKLSMQATQIYLNKSGHIGQQMQLMLAIKNMQQDFREAVAITNNNNSTYWVTITPPLKSTQADGTTNANTIGYTTVNGAQILQLQTSDATHPLTAQQIHYFLGMADASHPTPVADGDMLYRAVGAAGSGNTFPAAQKMIEVKSIDKNPLAIHMDRDTSDTTKPVPTFMLNSNSNPSNANKCVTVMLTIPITDHANKDLAQDPYRTLTTRFFCRNIQ